MKKFIAQASIFPVHFFLASLFYATHTWATDAAILQLKVVTSQPPHQACVVLLPETPFKTCTNKIVNIPAGLVNEGLADTETSTPEDGRGIPSIAFFPLHAEHVQKIEGEIRRASLYTIFFTNASGHLISSSVERLQSESIVLLTAESQKLYDDALRERRKSLFDMQLGFNSVSAQISSMSSELLSSQELKEAVLTLQVSSNTVFREQERERLLLALQSEFHAAKEHLSTSDDGLKATLTSALRKILEIKALRQHKGVPRIRR